MKRTFLILTIVTSSILFIHSCKLEVDPPLLKITEPKTIASGLKEPAGMDVDANGNVIVADMGDHVIRRIIFGPTGVATGTVIAGTIGSAGTLPSVTAPTPVPGSSARFNRPQDVAIDAAGNIYVADNGNHCIRKITKDPPYTVSTAAGTPGTAGNPDKFFTGPQSVAFGTTNIYVTEPTKSRLCYFQNTTPAITEIKINVSPPLSAPTVAYSRIRNPQYRIFVCDREKRILQVNPDDGKVDSNIRLDFIPQDLDLDETGNIVVLDKEGSKVYVVYKDNNVKELTGFGQLLNKPSGLAIDTKNKLIYISNGGANSIIKANYQ